MFAGVDLLEPTRQVARYLRPGSPPSESPSVLTIVRLIPSISEGTDLSGKVAGGAEEGARNS